MLRSEILLRQSVLEDFLRCGSLSDNRTLKPSTLKPAGVIIVENDFARIFFFSSLQDYGPPAPWYSLSDNRGNLKYVNCTTRYPCMTLVLTYVGMSEGGERVRGLPVETDRQTETERETHTHRQTENELVRGKIERERGSER